MIYARMGGIVTNGTVLLRCRDCNTGPNDEAYTAHDVNTPQILMVCQNGHPLGQWDTVEQRDTELVQFRENILQHHVPVKKRPPGKHSSKAESKSKNMSWGRSGAKKKNPKRGRKRGSK